MSCLCVVETQLDWTELKKEMKKNKLLYLSFLLNVILTQIELLFLKQESPVNKHWHVLYSKRLFPVHLLF